MTGRALLLGLLLFLDAASRPEILVVYHSRQPRWVAPLGCAGCTLHDLARDPLPARRYDTVVLDGHSLPGLTVLGADEARIRALLSRAAPRLVIALTCYGAELHLLSEIFKVASIEEVLAAPAPLPWTGLRVDDACVLREGPRRVCFAPPQGMRAYRRDDLLRAGRLADEARQRLRRCDAVRTYARLRPRYVCLEDGVGPPALLKVESHEVNPDCPADPLAVRVRPCGAGRDPAPAAPAPG
jgi:hypothetical protein